MDIRQVGMTRKHYQSGEASRVRMVVLHATAGRFPGDYHWLRNGGNDRRPVSVHYYIDKAGAISQMVQDKDIAWHAGKSRWVVDGREVINCNAVSLGIELENLNTGRDPYPQAQYDAAVWLTRQLVQRYDIPRGQLVRHLDIAPGRKTDPAGFPWERFVAEVYATGEPVADPGGLRRLLIDAAYRAAGGAWAPGWPLHEAAAARRLGMPVGAVTARQITARPAGQPWRGEAQDDLDRAVHVAGQQLVVEIYARDLVYAPVDRPDQVRLLSETAEGPLRDGLTQALFLTADPAAGFRPDWSFHQVYQKHARDLGVPIGPNHRLATRLRDGRAFACQHFALDTLCSPIGQWRTVIRLSELVGDVMRPGAGPAWRRELALLLLDDLYRSRARHGFDEHSLLCRYALSAGLGAPLARPTIEQLDGAQLLVVSFAADVVFCQVTSGDGWNEPGYRRLSEVLGDADGAGPVAIGRLSAVLQGSPGAGGGPLAPAGSGAGGVRLLGQATRLPVVSDLTQRQVGVGIRDQPPSLLIIYPTGGPLLADLAPSARPDGLPWHYYVDQTGTILRLADERRILPNVRREREPLDQALAIGVEGGAGAVSADQARALAWLIGCIRRRFSLTERQVVMPQRRPARRARQ